MLIEMRGLKTVPWQPCDSADKIANKPGALSMTVRWTIVPPGFLFLAGRLCAARFHW